MAGLSLVKGSSILKILASLFTSHLACVAGENGEGKGEQGHGRKMGDWGLGTRERLLQRIIRTIYGIPVENINKIIASMPDRLDAIIDNKGCRTKY